MKDDSVMARADKEGWWPGGKNEHSLLLLVSAERLFLGCVQVLGGPARFLNTSWVAPGLAAPFALFSRAVTTPGPSLAGMLHRQALFVRLWVPHSQHTPQPSESPSSFLSP